MILLGTRSAGKLGEMRALLEAAGLELTDPRSLGVAETAREEQLEVFDTFEENALAKARYFADRAGLPTIADDSGLEVFALGGRPGVRSKRFSGRADLHGRALDEANNALLQAQLAEHSDRRARFVCAVALVRPDGHEMVRRGETAGRITFAPRGTGGFGYDPYFESAELGLTFAEASIAEKERISHRGRALRALLEAM